MLGKWLCLYVNSLNDSNIVYVARILRNSRHHLVVMHQCDNHDNQYVSVPLTNYRKHNDIATSSLEMVIVEPDKGYHRWAIVALDSGGAASNRCPGQPHGLAGQIVPATVEQIENEAQSKHRLRSISTYSNTAQRT